MDFVDTALLAGVFVCVILLITLVIGLCDIIIHTPERAENANAKCRERGYDQYAKYSSNPLSSDVYGVKCEYVGYEVNAQINQEVK